MIENTPENIFAMPIRVLMRLPSINKKIELYFRRLTVKDKYWAFDKFGNEEKFVKGIEKVDEKILIPTFFHQLTIESKKKLPDQKHLFKDIDENDREFFHAETSYQIFEMIFIENIKEEDFITKILYGIAGYSEKDMENIIDNYNKLDKKKVKKLTKQLKQLTSLALSAR